MFGRELAATLRAMPDAPARLPSDFYHREDEAEQQKNLHMSGGGNGNQAEVGKSETRQIIGSNADANGNKDEAAASAARRVSALMGVSQSSFSSSSSSSSSSLSSSLSDARFQTPLEARGPVRLPVPATSLAGTQCVPSD